MDSMKTSVERHQMTSRHAILNCSNFHYIQTYKQEKCFEKQKSAAR